METDTKRDTIQADEDSTVLHTPSADNSSDADKSAKQKTDTGADTPIERGGPKGAEPTRFGDWEKNGRCTDF